MAKIRYREKRFREDSLATIRDANRIIEAYQAEGYVMTLRQLYYQFVSLDLIRNTMKEYNRLKGIVSDARLAGLIDWEAIEDRTRELQDLPHWARPSDFALAGSQQFRTERWENQPCRIEVWIEKEALAGVFERICESLDVPFLCCRGYLSQSEMWAAAQRFVGYEEDGQEVIVLHFGDHDPSGIDMSRDIEERLELFEANADVRRIALNFDQVEEWGPPPNPAKHTDARFKAYRRRFGAESWELDALRPQVLAELVERHVRPHIDEDAWEESEQEIELGRRQLMEIRRRWRDVVEFLEVEK